MTIQHEVGFKPVLKQISARDVVAALKAGLADFLEAPLYGLFFGAVFSVIGMVVSWLLVVHASSYWVLPIAAGFPLIGPFAAVGLYDVSRRRELGEMLNWADVLGAVVRQGRLQLPSYAFVALFVYLIWVYLAHLIFALSFGLKPLTNVMSSGALLLTGEGITMLTVGTLVGGALAGVLFVVSAISVPLLLHRDIDVVSAMITSVRAVLMNRRAMALWAVIVATSIGCALLPMFVLMPVVFPILGHASWHLYRRTIE